MNLFKRNHNYWLWYWRVFGVLLRRRFFTTSVVVVLSTASIITSFLAFMLPLKVIILAGSEGVPRYFRFFIDPDEKWEWIIIFTVGAIACYLLTLLFDAITKRMSVTAGSELLESANDLTVVSNQETVVGGYYGKFCSVQAALLFGLASMALLALINPPVFAYVAAVLVLQFLLTAWAMSGQDDVNPGPFKRYVRDKYKNYVGFLSNFIFLSGFLLILYPYLVGEGPNILFSLISFLLLRRMLGVMGGVATTGVELEKARLKINALLFREHQLVKKEKPSLQALRDAFAKPRRTALVKRVIAELADIRGREGQQQAAESDVEVCWQDSPIRSVTTLVVQDPVKTANGSETRHYQVQICSQKQSILLDNEERLFDYIPRAQLWAPEVLARFEEARFHCQLLRYGNGEPLSSGDWKQWELPVFEHLWSTAIPEALRTAYGASHRWLHQRLDDEYIRRVDIAVDTTAERQLFDRFMAQLATLQERLKALPIAVHNPALKTSDTVVHDGKGGIQLVTWGTWSLEPIGYFWPRSASEEELEECVARLRQARKDIPADFGLPGLKLARLAAELEKAVNRSNYKAALGTMAEMLAVTQEEPVAEPAAAALSAT